ncbi:hypothetical protein GCM10010121_075420 [Streptomyces brasiliensis]|uniref:Uncharacterized protein n=1 Tax=Streptomyces brasiliensis TaxID=1954 RepID=A0A917P1U4_9ACTN|nr:hypothetical protein GCM10010121_075420 [Streptomyces brasiliensis]
MLVGAKLAGMSEIPVPSCGSEPAGGPNQESEPAGGPNQESEPAGGPNQESEPEVPRATAEEDEETRPPCRYGPRPPTGFEPV